MFLFRSLRWPSCVLILFYLLCRTVDLCSLTLRLCWRCPSFRYVHSLPFYVLDATWWVHRPVFLADLFPFPGMWSIRPLPSGLHRVSYRSRWSCARIWCCMFLFWAYVHTFFSCFVFMCPLSVCLLFFNPSMQVVLPLTNLHSRFFYGPHLLIYMHMSLHLWWTRF